MSVFHWVDSREALPQQTQFSRCRVGAPALTITGSDVQKVVAAVSSASRDMVTYNNPFHFRFAVEFFEGTNSLGAIYSDGEWLWICQRLRVHGFHYRSIDWFLVDRRQYKFKSDIMDSSVFDTIHKEFNKK